MAERGKRKIPSWFHPAALAPPEPQETDAADVADDEKIEEFYKLIRKMIAERELCQSNLVNEKKRQIRETELWKPKFEWEDFAGDSHGEELAVRNGEHGRKKSRKERDEKEEDETSVDLNLGL